MYLENPIDKDSAFLPVKLRMAGHVVGVGKGCKLRTGLIYVHKYLLRIENHLNLLEVYAHFRDVLAYHGRVIPVGRIQVFP